MANDSAVFVDGEGEGVTKAQCVEQSTKRAKVVLTSTPNAAELCSFFSHRSLSSRRGVRGGKVTHDVRDVEEGDDVEEDDSDDEGLVSSPAPQTQHLAS